MCAQVRSLPVANWQFANAGTILGSVDPGKRTNGAAR
jgi:hypothetical protein